MAVLIFPDVALRGNLPFPAVVAAPVKYCPGCGEEENLEHKATVFASKISNSSERWLGTHITKRGGTMQSQRHKLYAFMEG